MGLNPFDWYGTEFLVLYGVLFAIALAASFTIAASLRPVGRPFTLSDPDEQAVLQSGRDRLGESIIARLMARDALAVQQGKLVRTSSSGGGTLENAVLRLPVPLKWKDLRKLTDASAERIEATLASRGLLLDEAERRELGLYALLPLFLLLAFGLAKVLIGLSRDRPVAFLVFALIVTVVVALIRWRALDRRTKAGLDAAGRARDQGERLWQGHTRDEAGLAVALFGTSILVGSPMAGLHDWRRHTTDGGGSSSSGDGDGGGGGCGGCGD